jgi:hypothetical protein
MNTCESAFSVETFELENGIVKPNDERTYPFTHHLHTLHELIANGPVEFYPDDDWDEFQLMGTVGKEITGSPILYGARLYVPDSLRARESTHLIINIIPDTATHTRSAIYQRPKNAMSAYRIPLEKLQGPLVPLTRAGLEALAEDDDGYTININDEQQVIAELSRLGWVAGLDQLQIFTQKISPKRRKGKRKEIMQPTSIFALLDDQWARRQYLINESDAWDRHFPSGNGYHH